MNMISDVIKAILKKKKMTNKELAAACGWSAGNLCNRMRRNTWQVEDLEKIAEALNCDLEITLTERE